jgi:hypothetical protein
MVHDKDKAKLERRESIGFPQPVQLPDVLNNKA